MYETTYFEVERGRNFNIMGGAICSAHKDNWMMFIHEGEDDGFLAIALNSEHETLSSFSLLNTDDVIGLYEKLVNSKYTIVNWPEYLRG